MFWFDKKVVSRVGLGWMRWWLRRRGAEAEAGPLLQMRGSSHRLRGRTGSQLQSRGSLVTGCLSSKGLCCFLLFCSFTTYVDKFLKEKWNARHKAGWFVWKSQVPGSSQLVLTTGQWPVWEKGNFDQVKGLCRCPEAHQQMTKKIMRLSLARVDLQKAKWYCSRLSRKKIERSFEPKNQILLNQSHIALLVTYKPQNLLLPKNATKNSCWCFKAITGLSKVFSIPHSRLLKKAKPMWELTGH